MRRDAASFRVGGSQLRWDGEELVVEIDEYGAPLGGRVVGEVRLRPTRIQPQSFELDPDGHHHWWPVAPHARAEVRLERPGLRFSGSAYHDTNYGDEPLEARFKRWSWSRAEIDERAVVLYDAITRDGVRRPRALAFGDGPVEEVEVPEVHALRRGLWGVGGETRTDAGAQPRILRRLEDGPHYTRSILATQLLGRQVEAVHESLDLERFRRPIVQGMLHFRMRWGWRAGLPPRKALSPP